MTQNPLSQAAHDLLDFGFSVIPLTTRGKQPRIRWNKYQVELPQHRTIEGWWRIWPEANIGIVTGLVSGLVVIDVDQGGLPELERMAGQVESEFPETAVVKTGVGLHYYFQHPGSGHFVPNTSNRTLALDLRGDGGYVVAPPSLHPGGAAYEWVRAPQDAELPALPDWAVGIVPEKKRNQRPQSDPLVR